mgnify:CR=1 FL=1
MKRTRVKNIEQLKKICLNDYQDFYIQLNFGCRSSKEIMYSDTEDVFYVNNNIDGTCQECTPKQIEQETNIIKAIECGSLIHENY